MTAYLFEHEILLTRGFEGSRYPFANRRMLQAICKLAEKANIGIKVVNQLSNKRNDMVTLGKKSLDLQQTVLCKWTPKI